MRWELRYAIVAGLACLAVPAQAVSNLADYDGKYPSDEVGGTTFLEEPAVVRRGVGYGTSARGVGALTGDEHEDDRGEHHARGDDPARMTLKRPRSCEGP